MKQSTMTIRIDSELKNRVGDILDKLGLNHSEAVNVFYHLIDLNKGLPFYVKIPEKMPFDLIPAIRPKEKKKRGDLS